MNNPEFYHIDSLKVIAYADHFEETAVPVRCAPIFVLIEKENSVDELACIYPPYYQAADYVIKGTLVTINELKRRASMGQATILNEPLKAIPGGTIWIDQGLIVNYDSTLTVNRRLREMAQKAYKEAIENMDNGDIDAALIKICWANAADQQAVAPRALEAAIYHIKGEKRATKVVRRECQGLPDEESFEGHLQYFSDRYSKKSDSVFFDDSSEIINRFLTNNSAVYTDIPSLSSEPVVL